MTTEEEDEEHGEEHGEDGLEEVEFSSHFEGKEWTTETRAKLQRKGEISRRLEVKEAWSEEDGREAAYSS